ncbi:MAG TPA: ferredoxin reductase family protein [Trebonia sp.]|jgi:ferredoxin-NADP reductase|nr:ferredoxin reductase family protein [Trebonia sp.]
MTAAMSERNAPVPADPAAGLAPPPVRRAARAHPRVILALIGAGAAATIWLWWQGTPSIHGTGDWITNAGRILGLLAGYGIVVLIALMARIPPLERGIGAGQLARWHKMGGRYVVGLIVCHALLITWGYAITVHESIPGEAWTLLDSYPDVLMATVGGLLLLGVGIVSATAIRPRFKYETWYYLHLYTYLAVALAFSHQFANGAEFINNAAARWTWSALYIGVGLAIVWFRVVTPARQAVRHRFRVLDVRSEAPGVTSIIIGGRDVRRLPAEPGQFFRWRFLGPGLWWTSSPYSLSAPPAPDKLRITVKAAGEHSRLLARLKPGVRVVAEGPYGALTPAVRTKAKVALIAGGVGITPLRALFESLPAAPGDLTLIYRVTSPHDIVFRGELEQIAEQRGARLWFVAGRRGDLGGDPLNAAELLRRIPGLARHDVYVCGPPGMTESVIRELRSAGVRRGRIHHESFEF